MYTEASVKKALREKICNGLEGHALLVNEAMQRWDMTDGTVYAGFFCKKCGGMIFVDEADLEDEPSLQLDWFNGPRPTPRIP